MFDNISAYEWFGYGQLFLLAVLAIAVLPKRGPLRFATLVSILLTLSWVFDAVINRGNVALVILDAVIVVMTSVIALMTWLRYRHEHPKVVVR